MRHKTKAEIVSAGLRDSTRLGYASQLRTAAKQGLQWPPTTDDVAEHVAELVNAEYALASIRKRLASIRAGLRGDVDGFEAGPCLDAGQLAPLVRGARRVARTSEQALPLRAFHVRAMVEGASARDRAVILCGWVGALRRAELVALNVGSGRVVAEGLELTLRGTKSTDEAAIVCLPVASNGQWCPVRSWLDLVSGRLNPDAPAFTSGRRGERLGAQNVTRIVKRMLERAGFPTAGYSSHSLRAGAATEAAAQGRDLGSISRHLRHGHVQTTRRYTDRGELWERSPMSGLLENVSARPIEHRAATLGPDEVPPDPIARDRSRAATEARIADQIAGAGIVSDDLDQQ